MRTNVYLKGKTGAKLTINKDSIVVDAGQGAVSIPLQLIRQINLVPLRRSSHWYFPPAVVIKADSGSYRISTRKGTWRPSSMLESSKADLAFMAGMVKELHKAIVSNNPQNSIRFLFEGPLFKGALFVYPIFLAAPVISGFSDTPYLKIVIFLVLLGFLFLAWLAKKRSYDPIEVADDIKEASFYLS